MKWMAAMAVAAAVTMASEVWAAAPAGRFVLDSGNVKDTVTKLVWQQGVAPNNSSYTQLSAATYCTSLTSGPLTSGWRLPTKQELETIIDFRAATAPATDTTAFPGTPSLLFWTSTALAGTAGSGWMVHFASGVSASFLTMTTGCVRCVHD